MLPQRVDPFRFAQLGVKLEAQIPADKLNRLQAAVNTVPENVLATLEFSRDAHGYRVIQGDLSATVEVMCQRCLEPMVMPLQTQVNLAVVLNEDQAKLLPKSLDPWLLEGETDDADLYEVLEDELLLSLPIVAAHEHPCLDADSYSSAIQETVTATTDAVNQDSEQAEASDNPFKILEQLKVKSTAEK